MRNKLILFCTVGAAIAVSLINSCKKSAEYLPTLLTNQKWQLASVTVTNYTGATQNSVDTLNTDCNQTQYFQFGVNGGCTYTNFDCLQGTTGSGHWSFSADHLYLNTDMVCQDTSATGSSVPFKTARIINLGQYSMVLQTGNLETYYPPTQQRRVIQWGFVRVKSQ